MASSKAATTTKPAEPAAAAPGPIVKSNGVISRVAARFNVDPTKMLTTLKQTAFRSKDRDGKWIEVTDEQMMALLVIADEYSLNPWLKEIYAFPDKSGGIVPVIGVDGWIRMINTHPQFAAMELRLPEDLADDVIPNWMECVIWRKDREKPTIVREYYAEVKRSTDPWRDMPRRMLRHKTIIQCGRVAFGFSGVFDPDEAERIREAVDVTPRAQGRPETQAPVAKQPDVPAIANNDQLKLIRAQVEQKGITENDLCEKFDLGKLEDLKFDQVQPALDWIREVAG
jgi:phage recombination protein Bet